MVVEVKKMPVPDTDPGMILKYMRAGGAKDEPTLNLVNNALLKMSKAASPLACFTRLNVSVNDVYTDIAGNVIKSAYLAKHLKNAKEAFLFAATLGTGSERIIRLEQSLSPAMSYALDAAGSAMIEDVCDALNESLSRSAATENKITLRRYSPGYGDFPIETQKLFTVLLNTPKNIGAVLTEGMMLYPTKTVTAIIGIEEKT